MDEKMLNKAAEELGVPVEVLKDMPEEILNEMLDNDKLFGIRMSKNNEWKQYQELCEDAYVREVDKENAVDLLYFYPDQKMVKFTRLQFKDESRTHFNEVMVQVIDCNMAKFIVEKLGE
jgi:hypothetical protein